MGKNFLPSVESKLVIYTETFSSKIGKNPTDFAITAAQATSYETVQKSWSDSYAVYQDPTQKTKPNLQIKLACKKAVVEMTRELARIIQASPAVSDARRAELGLPVRKGEPTPIGVPPFAPKVDIDEVYAQTVKGRLHDLATGKRSKPPGCASAAIFAYVGPTPSDDPKDYQWQGTTTRTDFSVTFPTDLAPGTKVWIVACWQNPRGQAGPASAAVSALIAGGSISRMAV